MSEAITREEMFLRSLVSGNPCELKPITRTEMFLASLAGQNIVPPEPITREEMYLARVETDGETGSKVTVTDDGAGNLTISNAAVTDNDGALTVSFS